MLNVAIWQGISCDYRLISNAESCAILVFTLVVSTCASIRGIKCDCKRWQEQLSPCSARNLCHHESNDSSIFSSFAAG